MPALIQRRLERSSTAVEKYLTRYLITDSSFTKKMLDHITLYPGKRLRAQVTLLSGMGIKSRLTPVEKLAAAIECFHQATLIHDDVIDAAPIRRQQSSLNKQFGNQAAVMLGDYLLTQVMTMMFREMPETVQRIMAQAISRVCLGELEEIGATYQFDLSQPAYLKMIENKTAALFAAACQAGAVLGGHTPKRQAALRQFGLKLGMAFQITDDILDLIAPASKTGKQPKKDIIDGRITLPIIIALAQLPKKSQALLKRVIRQGKTQSKLLRGLLDQVQAIEQSRDLARTYHRAAIRSINQLPVSPVKTGLISLADFSVDRDY